MNRREFILSSLATGILCDLPLTAGAAVHTKGLRLKVGVLSDPHVSSIKTTEGLVRAFRFFRAEGVDAVLVTGDLTDGGLRSQLKALADAWYGVFPDGKGVGGAKVEKLLLFGNHDIFDSSSMAPIRKRYPTLEACRADTIARDDRGAFEEILGEPYERIGVRTVRGYPFLMFQWSRQCWRGLDGGYGALKAKLDPAQPFFYCHHFHPKGTVFGGRTNYDDGTAMRVLGMQTNCLAISGHSHQSLTDDRSYWQEPGKLTSVAAGSIRDLFLLTGYENGPVRRGEKTQPQMGELCCRNACHGQLMTVFDDRIVFDRYSFASEVPVSLGASWTFPLPLGRERPFSAVCRSASAFVPSAKVSVRRLNGLARGAKKGSEQPQVEIVFPQCAFEYEVAVMEADGQTPGLRKRVLSPDFFKPSFSSAQSARCVFSADELPSDREVVFRITPYSSLSEAGRPVFAKL